MRRTGFALLSTGVLLVAGTVGIPRAEAMTAGAAPAGLRAAIAATNSVSKASCFRYGWRGWATYHSCDTKHERKKPREKRR